jgi:hypothetical protein
MFTFYDRIILEDLIIIAAFKEKFILIKSIDDKIFIYASKDLV